MLLPGFVNAHSHTFQRALRGRTDGEDFWGWRDAMLALADEQTPERVRTDCAATYAEMRSAGYTAVGEFHYLGLPEAFAAAEAASKAGIDLVLLLAAYERGGLPRFRQESAAAFVRQVEELAGAGVRVGVAPHSVRACSEEWLREVGRYAEHERLVLHAHADEQPREIEECVAEYGVRPVELLARAGCLGAHTTVVHATHADDRELDLIADAGARICVCPTTEASLGDGFVPVEAILARGIEVCIGSDSNVRIDPLDELRELEGIARRTLQCRNVFGAETLLRYGSAVGAAALGLERWADTHVELDHPSLRGVEPADVPAALVEGCAADVFAASDDQKR
jgi:formimidoylglutamate deiminase